MWKSEAGTWVWRRIRPITARVLTGSVRGSDRSPRELAQKKERQRQHHRREGLCAGTAGPFKSASPACGPGTATGGMGEAQSQQWRLQQNEGVPSPPGHRERPGAFSPRSGTRLGVRLHRSYSRILIKAQTGKDDMKLPLLVGGMVSCMENPKQSTKILSVPTHQCGKVTGLDRYTKPSDFYAEAMNPTK